MPGFYSHSRDNREVRELILDTYKPRFLEANPFSDYCGLEKTASTPVVKPLQREQSHVCIPDNQVWLTERQASTILGCSLSKLQKDRHNGVGLVYAKNGKSVRYHRDTIKKFMEEKQIKPFI